MKLTSEQMKKAERLVEEYRTKTGMIPDMCTWFDDILPVVLGLDEEVA